MDLNGRFRCSGKAVVRRSFLNAVVCWTLAESLGAFSALREAPRWRLITTEFDGAVRELLRNLAESLLRVSVRFLPPTASLRRIGLRIGVHIDSELCAPYPTQNGCESEP